MAAAQTTETVFDTHAHVRALTAAEMPEPQAEAVVRLQLAVLQHRIVTNPDAAPIRTHIDNLARSTQTEFGNVRSEIDDLRRWAETEFEALET